MKIIICGAGVIGVTTAWFLRQSGHDVIVIDRLEAPAEETSFANGGQISVGHTEPWAHPDILPKLWEWLGQPDAPMRFKWQWDCRQWMWGSRFLRECTLKRAEWNTLRLSALGLYSRQCLRELRETLPIDYEGRQKGILHLYTNAKEFEAAAKRAELIQRFGIERTVVDSAACLKIEPALIHTSPPLVGGTFTSDDESGDACLFTKALAAYAAEAGVDFRFNTEIESIELDSAGRVNMVFCRDKYQTAHTLSADIVVVAAGIYSPQLLNPLGISIPVYPLKGYSATFDVIDETKAPVVSLTDENKKMVFSRFKNRYRAAGMAEMVGFDKTIETVRCEAIRRRVETLFPGAFNTETAVYWAGLRPATPTNVPIIGATPIPGLYLNTGHGTLGWTLSCGSARLLTALINREQPPVNAAFYALDHH